MANNKTTDAAIISSRAQKEIAFSWQWYEDRQPGLGDRFLNAVIDRIRTIEQNPDRYPTRYKAYKETMLEDFPFLVIYRVSNKQKVIRIVPVFHTSKSPKRKYK